MALVLVLLVLSVLTAMVVEFAYGIYVNTSLLTNWQRLQEITLAAESGVSVAVEGQKLRQVMMKGKSVKDDYFNVRELQLPQMDPFELGIGVGLTVIDEHSKFNINRIEKFTGAQTEPFYEALKRLLEALELKDVLAESIRGYMYGIGTDKTELRSVEELLLVAGIDREVYNTLSPYVTVFGNGSISVNTAEKPVLMALAPNVTDEMAETAVQKRPFGSIGEFTGIQGFAQTSSMITVKGNTFGVISKAMDSDGLTREIRCVMTGNGSILYWREL
jgi:type II secretory pathway component PulK